MNATDAVKEAAGRAKVPVSHIGPRMGSQPNYVSTMITRGSSPRADTLARMADTIGYRLVLVPSGNVPKDGIVIDE